jgi:hypothetical protein
MQLPKMSNAATILTLNTMTTDKAQKIIDGHSQIYLKSCSPSVIEMLLKLEGKVPPDFYELQHQHKNDPVGLDFAREKTIKGMTFHQHDATKDGPFADRIASELKAGRFVGIYALNDGSKTDYHGWIAIGLTKDGQIILRSKLSEDGNGSGKITVPNDSHNLANAVAPVVTDCVFYNFPEPPSTENQS